MYDHDVVRRYADGVRQLAEVVEIVRRTLGHPRVLRRTPLQHVQLVVANDAVGATVPYPPQHLAGRGAEWGYLCQEIDSWEHLHIVVDISVFKLALPE